MSKKKKNKSKGFKGLMKQSSNMIYSLRCFLSAMMVKKKRTVVPWSKMLHLFLFPMLFIYYELLLKIFTGTGIFNHLVFPILFGLVAGIMANGLTVLLKKRQNRRISIVLMVIISAYYITECLVKRTFHVYMSLFSLFTNAGGVIGHYTAGFFSTIISGFIAIIVFLLPVVLYCIFGKRYLPANQYRWPVALGSFVSSGIIFVASFALVMISSSKPLYTTSFDFNLASENFGLLTGTRLSLTKKSNSLVVINPTNGIESDFTNYKKNIIEIDFDQLIENDKKDFKEIDEYVSQLSGTSMNKYTGIFKNKNIILVCAEAWSDVAVFPELTPTLYRMIHNGFYFSDFYQPYWGGSTTTGEFSFLFGLVPGIDMGTITDTEGDNNYFTLPNQFQREGYYTIGFHNGLYDFYDRNKTHPNIGLNKWYGIGNGIEKISGKEKLSDEDLFHDTISSYIDKQPFCSYYMTVDGHMPYPYEDYEDGELLEYIKEVLGNDYGENAYAYFCKQYQLEKAMNTLVQDLEEQGIADDTVICIVADHYPYGLEPEGFEELYGEDSDFYLNRDRNAWVLWSSCLEEGGALESYQCEIQEPTYSLDVVPTLSNLFGLNYDSRMLVGRDVFSDGMPLVLWNDFSWLSEKGFYSAKTGEFFPYEGETDYDDAYIENISNLVRSKKDYSTKVRELDYFAHVFGKDEITDSTNLWKEKYRNKKKNEDS
ncbi:MAG: sulfatase-like hydrolase/transferase [Firmicutes bacterium]|nr:sulfatase-like hydrolase/transferase [Bacillota bacterium]